MRENHYAIIVSLFENFSGFQSYKISITPLYILICLGDGIHQIRFKITKLSRHSHKFWGENLHISLTFLSFFLFLITFHLSHQIFRDQISKHRLRKIRYSRLLNQSIFWLILSDNKLTVSPIYACIQMEVGFVSLLYTNICTTFAIFSKEEEELLSLSSTPHETR